nr:MAG TPA: hypothetical protein [Caudoviricetes sp.]
MMRQRLKGMSVATPGSGKALQEPFCRVASIMLPTSHRGNTW